MLDATVKLSPSGSVKDRFKVGRIVSMMLIDCWVSASSVTLEVHPVIEGGLFSVMPVPLPLAEAESLTAPSGHRTNCSC